MQYFIGFLIVTFILGGTRAGAVLRERPLLLIGCCILVAASFYNLRVVT